MSRERPVKNRTAGPTERSLASPPPNKMTRAIVARLRAHGEAVRRAWKAEMAARRLLQRLTPEEAEAESAAIYDVLMECLETGRYHSAQAYAEEVAERDVFRGIGAKQVIGRLLVLRDVCSRFICLDCERHGADQACALDVYEPVANRILTIVAMAFVQERERAVGRGREQLGALVEAGLVLAAERSLTSVLQRIVELACRLLHATYGALGVLDANGLLEQFVSTGLDEATRARIGPLPTGQGILGIVVREARPLRLRDLTGDPRATGFPPHHPPMRSFLGVPIMSKGRVFGNLYVTDKQGAEEFTKEDEQLAVTLAAQAAIAIENASLYDKLRRSYEELKQSQDLLVRQEKLASLGRLAAGLAHELNNPLSSVAGFAEALQRRMSEGGGLDASGSGECREYLDMIQSEVARAAGIVRRLLDFARQREPSFGPVNLLQVVREAVSFAERQASLANRQIQVESFPETYEVLGDDQMLQQVVLNLLTNALDAIEGGGMIQVSARLAPAEHPGTQAARHAGERSSQDAGPSDLLITEPTAWVDLVVSDTGSGIAPENLNKVMDPFFTTKEVGKGTGLGLAICQSIVEQHGGRLSVWSKGLGEGTAVTVRLPLVFSAGHGGQM